MTKMIALKPHRYGSRQLKPGEAYEVTKPSDLRLVRALGWSKDAPSTTASAAAAQAPSAPKGKGKGYGRRDLVAAPAEPIKTVVETAEEAAAPVADANTIAEQTPGTDHTYATRALGAE